MTDSKGGVDTMTKKDLIRATAKAAGVTQETAGKVLTAAIDTITATVANGEPVKIHHFGTMYLKHYEARQRRNPATGEQITQQPYDRIKFTAADTLQQLINGAERG